MVKKLKLLHPKSNVLDKAPSASTINYGEIAVNYNSESPALYIRDDNDDIVKFISEPYFEKIVGTGITENDGTIVPISEVIQQDEKTVSAAINELNEVKYVKPLTGIPASDLASGVIPDVSHFITNTVDNLTNYYLKTETYTQTEVNNLIGADVKYTAQTLTAAEQAQARTNIGAGTYSKPSAGIPASDIATGVIPDAVEANPVVPTGETSYPLTGLAIGDNYYDVPNILDVDRLKIECEDSTMTGTTSQSDFTTYNGIYINENTNKWSTSNTNTALLRIGSNAVYTITFDNGIGGYCVVKNASCVSGENVVYSDGYSQMVYVAQGTVATITGHTGDYLCVRADTVSGGRKFPSNISYITTVFAKCYDEIHPAVGNTQPQGGFVPNKLYTLGTISGNVTFALAAPTDLGITNHYFWTFETSTTVPTITWPSGITWSGGSAPEINESKHYEISVLNGYGVFLEV